MPLWLTIAGSPIFRFAAALLVLGLLRLALLTVWEMRQAVLRAGDRRIPYGRILREILGWSLPLARAHRTRPMYSYASFIFHLGLLPAGLFLNNHIDIVQANFGLGWAALARPVLDVLTLAAILGGGYLLLHRVYVESSRKLSQTTDYLLLALILAIFTSGYLAGRPWNPIPYEGLMLFHTLGGILLLVVIPFTKIAHCILYPLVRMGTEVAWHFPPMGGRQVVEALHGPEGRRV
jgi:hypothetical protein